MKENPRGRSALPVASLLRRHGSRDLQLASKELADMQQADGSWRNRKGERKRKEGTFSGCTSMHPVPVLYNHLVRGLKEATFSRTKYKCTQGVHVSEREIILYSELGAKIDCEADVDYSVGIIPP